MATVFTEMSRDAISTGGFGLKSCGKWAGMRAAARTTLHPLERVEFRSVDLHLSPRESAGFTPEDFEERVEKDLLLCELCGSVVAPSDQIRWLIRRLGPLAFANPTLMMFNARELGVIDDGVRRQGENPLRSDRLALQCPKCRRETAHVN